MSSYLKLISGRRTIYALSKENFPISNKEVVNIVQDVIALTPSSFNNQTNRAIVVFGSHHEKVWKAARSNLKQLLPEDQFVNTSAKLDGFAGAYGTVLFFEDTATVKEFEEKFAIYAKNFVPWAEQSSGSAQISVWTALANEGVGANLQHYNEIIEKDIAKEFSVPEHWKLAAQLVFGAKAGEPYEKTTLPASETVKVYE